MPLFTPLSRCPSASSSSQALRGGSEGVGPVGGVRTVWGSSHPPRTCPMETTPGLGASFQRPLQPCAPERDPPDGVSAVTLCSWLPIGHAQHLAAAVNGLGRLRHVCHVTSSSGRRIQFQLSQPEVVIDRDTDTDTDTDTEACVCIEKNLTHTLHNPCWLSPGDKVNIPRERRHSGTFFTHLYAILAFTWSIY